MKIPSKYVWLALCLVACVSFAASVSDLQTVDGEQRNKVQAIIDTETDGMVTTTSGDSRYVNTSGDTMTGALTISNALNITSGTTTNETAVLNYPGLRTHFTPRQITQLRAVSVNAGAVIGGSYSLLGTTGSIRFPETGGSPYYQLGMSLNFTPGRNYRVISTFSYETNYINTAGAYDILFEYLYSTNRQVGGYVTVDSFCPTTIATNSTGGSFVWTNTVVVPSTPTYGFEIYMLRATASGTDTAVGGLSEDKQVIEEIK